MDTLVECLYIMGHETPWETCVTRKAPAARLAPAEIGSQLPLCGHRSEILPEFCGTLVSELPAAGLARSTAPSDARTATVALDRAKAGACPDFGGWSAESRVSNRLVDAEARGRSDEEALWRRILPFQSMAADERVGVELPGA